MITGVEHGAHSAQCLCIVICYECGSGSGGEWGGRKNQGLCAVKKPQ